MNNEELNNKTIMEEIRKLGCYPSEFDVARHFFALGKQEQKEQMMKEAVEGNIYGVDEQWVESEVVEHIGQEGDKIKLIIIKED